MTQPYRPGGVRVQIGAPAVIVIADVALRVRAKASDTRGRQAIRVGGAQVPLSGALARVEAAEAGDRVALALEADGAATGITLSLHPRDAAARLATATPDGLERSFALEAPEHAPEPWEGAATPADLHSDGACDAPARER